MAVQSGERRHLICHPGTPAKAVRAVWAEVALSFEDGFSLRFGVEGDIGALVLPPCEGQLVIADTATDGLWQSSCFEAFLTEEGQPDYTEFNYAPDGRWACYPVSYTHLDVYKRQARDEPVLLCPQADRHVVFAGHDQIMRVADHRAVDLHRPLVELAARLLVRRRKTHFAQRVQDADPFGRGRDARQVAADTALFKGCPLYTSRPVSNGPRLRGGDAIGKR